MATQADVRRIALSLPETEDTRDRFAFSVRNTGKLKRFVWVWMERVTARELRPLITEARRCQASKDLDPKKSTPPRRGGAPRGSR